MIVSPEYMTVPSVKLRPCPCCKSVDVFLGLGIDDISHNDHLPESYRQFRTVLTLHCEHCAQYVATALPSEFDHPKWDRLVEVLAQKWNAVAIAGKIIGDGIGEAVE